MGSITGLDWTPLLGLIDDLGFDKPALLELLPIMEQGIVKGSKSQDDPEDGTDEPDESTEDLL